MTIVVAAQIDRLDLVRKSRDGASAVSCAGALRRFVGACGGGGDHADGDGDGHGDAEHLRAHVHVHPLVRLERRAMRARVVRRRCADSTDRESRRSAYRRPLGDRRRQRPLQDPRSRSPTGIVEFSAPEHTPSGATCAPRSIPTARATQQPARYGALGAPRRHPAQAFTARWRGNRPVSATSVAGRPSLRIRGVSYPVILPPGVIAPAPGVGVHLAAGARAGRAGVQLSIPQISRRS